MHRRIPHTFRSGCGVSSKGGIHWTTDMAYVTCPECIALVAPPSSPAQAEEEARCQNCGALTYWKVDRFHCHTCGHENGTARLVTKPAPPSSPVADSQQMPSRWHANQIVGALVVDLTDRRGFKQVWESLDAGIQAEILDAWEAIVDERLKASAPSPSAGAAKDKE